MIDSLSSKLNNNKNNNLYPLWPVDHVQNTNNAVPLSLSSSQAPQTHSKKKRRKPNKTPKNKRDSMAKQHSRKYDWASSKTEKNVGIPRSIPEIFSSFTGYDNNIKIGEQGNKSKFSFPGGYENPVVTPPPPTSYVLLKIPLPIYSREYGDFQGLQTPRAEWGGDFIVDSHVCWDSTRTDRHSIGDANTRGHTKKIRERKAQGSMLAPTLFPRRIIFYSRLNVSISLANPHKSHNARPSNNPTHWAHSICSGTVA